MNVYITCKHADTTYKLLVCMFESLLSCISVAVRSVSPSMDIPLTVLTPFVQALGQVSMFRERNVLVDLNVLTMGAGYLFEWSLS
jgi:hypothetical protein